MIAGWVLLVAMYCLLAFVSPARAESALTGVPQAVGTEVFSFREDIARSSLFPALKQSFLYLDRLPPENRYSLCGKEYSTSDLKMSLLEFVDLLGRDKSETALAREIRQRFDLCRAGGDSSGAILLTGYFEPLIAASLTRGGRYQYPIYRKPPNLVVAEQGRRIGRMDGGRLVPYWSRSEIEKGKLLSGNELAYLADPVDAFILQVQGSGRVRLPDGTVRRVQFAAKNGRPYRSIGRLLVDEGIMTLEEVNLPKIIEYLRDHPQDRQRILHHNEAYVFFRWGDQSEPGPRGCFGLPLTAGRSIALDQRCYPPGVIGFLGSRKPRVDVLGKIIGWQPLARFVVNQDSGSAIRGPGRADLFWGSGLYAEAAAGVTKHPARLYLLVKKK